MYQLAKNTSNAITKFGPVMSLDKAQAYQADMLKGGYDVLVMNVNTIIEQPKQKKIKNNHKVH